MIVSVWSYHRWRIWIFTCRTTVCYDMSLIVIYGFFFSCSVPTWVYEWFVVDRLGGESLCLYQGKGVADLFLWPVTSPPTLHCRECWSVKVLLVAQPSHFSGKFLGLSWYRIRMLLQNSCLPMTIWLLAWENIFNQCNTWLALYIDLCMYIANYNVASTYWAPYVSDLCALTYVLPDIMVESWNKISKATTPSMDVTEYAVMSLEVYDSVVFLFWVCGYPVMLRWLVGRWYGGYIPVVAPFQRWLG